ncbi:putative 3-oxoacyl-[acyl-carrier-protein] synthase III [Renibacterium salmoninarum ATCC 33209]|uniref:Putative 3-oxoacyl-[acyl-carrier-protein] synthase III n=2 Tax=Renibacterium salmoninarum TaxID=1646 RepID=A9WNA6_RENSM|nr:putative 3-oxoacyl-[acyl-carrier-protein] synthase III [Renibacterium salmoninarum ATCC 33209]
MAMGNESKIEPKPAFALPTRFRYWTLSLVGLLIFGFILVVGGMLRGALASSETSSLPISSSVPTIYVTKPPGNQASVSAADIPPVEAAPKSTKIPAGAVPPGDEPAFGTTALELLAQLPIRESASKTGYARSNFGPAWLDLQGKGCDARNEVLRRDLNKVSFTAGDKGCLVQSGEFSDPYLGTRITFDRSTAALVQVDQVVSLADAWQSGAQDLSAAQRIAFANDPLNLLAVDAVASLQKSSANAAGWLPSNSAFRCSYVARQISVKATYKLWVTQTEHDVLAGVLADCPQTLAPTDQVARIEVAAPPTSTSGTAPANGSTQPGKTPSSSTQPSKRPVPYAPIPQLPLPKPPVLPIPPVLFPPGNNSAPDQSKDQSKDPWSEWGPLNLPPEVPFQPPSGLWEEGPSEHNPDQDRDTGNVGSSMPDENPLQDPTAPVSSEKPTAPVQPTLPEQPTVPEQLTKDAPDPSTPTPVNHLPESPDPPVSTTAPATVPVSAVTATAPNQPTATPIPPATAAR